jgi:hypothetical protein
MGLLATNDSFTFGQNLERLQPSFKKNPAVEFRSRMDALRKRYELNHPLVHSATLAKQQPMIRTSHETNLPRTANAYSKHGKAWFS